MMIIRAERECTKEQRQGARRRVGKSKGFHPIMPRVLIIEDDAESRRVMADLFTRDDWKVLEAKDGDAGLELALRNRPELILCDLLMPKSNGFHVCRTIREQLQPTKIIVVSGRDCGVDRRSEEHTSELQSPM